MQRENLACELEENILSQIPLKSVARFRSVCKRWNALLNDMRFINNLLVRAKPQFILLSESKNCSIDVNLDGPSIKVHDFPSDIPNYRHHTPMTIEYCDGLLIYAASRGTGICNPLLRQIRWIKPKLFYCVYNGMGYDNTRPDKHYKILRSICLNYANLEANITDYESNAWKSYLFTSDILTMASPHRGVSFNGTLYWIAFNMVSRKHFIQSFEFSIESFKPYCILPGKHVTEDIRNLAVFSGDRFSVLEQEVETNNIEIWVTKNKIGEDVEWMKFMNVLVPTWWRLACNVFVPSYFIEEKTRSLVFCSFNENGTPHIYIAKGDEFHAIEINGFVPFKIRHRTYFPSLVPLPTLMTNDFVKPHFEFPNGVEATDPVGENEWDDGLFDNVKKISIGHNDLGIVFVKFDYSNNNTVVVGDLHGNATYVPDDDLLIDDDDYIEAVEGTYTQTHITSLAFKLHKKKMTSFYGLHEQNIPFVLRGRGLKITGFYGRNSDVHLTAFGVHFNSSN